MSDTGDNVDPVLGMDVSEAVEFVTVRERDADHHSAQALLRLVAEGEVVTREGIESALGDAANYVATPETRLELAGEALDAARETADPVDDLEIVASRLEGFEARYRGIDEEIDELEAQLDRLAERADEPRNVYQLARSIRETKWSARDAQRRADELAEDLESFEEWVEDPEVRAEELDEDVASVEELLDDLAEVIEQFEAASLEGDDADAGGQEDPGDADEDGDGSGEPENRPSEAAFAWIDAEFRRRVIGLLVSDLRAELADLRTWADREDAAIPGDEEIEARIDDLRSREEALGDRLDEVARPEWTDRFGEDMAAFEAELDAVDPPVDWGEVNDLLEEHRSAVIRT